MGALSQGAVTYLMTDVVGSTRLWEKHGDVMASVLLRHDLVAQDYVDRHHGHIVKNRGEGDSLFVVFESAESAVRAAHDLQTAFLAERWPNGIDLQVRIAVHTGESMVREGDYYGPAVNRCARLRAIAQGGQVLLTEATWNLVQNSGIEFRDLGRHRLRDLLRPERVAEIVIANAPETRLRSLNELRNNLPVQLTTFIGREDDILCARSRMESSRLITLTGAGGSGKTRLALQVAAESSHQFRNGLWFVDLSRQESGDDLVSFAAHEIGVNPNRESLVRTLQGERALLIADNCEHLVNDAASFVHDLLRSCPDLVILATSREALQLPGEVRLPVPPLETPVEGATVAEVEQSEAGRLFLERAILRQPTFQITDENKEDVGELCRLLDGIPLAIEQAASNVGFLSLAQLNARFRQSLRQLSSQDRSLNARHRSLYATMQWSYDMLTDAEREVFCRSSEFVGSWDLDAIEAICDTDDVMLHLQRLVDKSMVIAVDHGRTMRFQMLQSIRDFAVDCSRDAGLDTSERLARYYCGKYGKGLVTTSEAVEDHHNILRAIHWLFEHEEATARSLAINLRSYFMVSEQFESGKHVMLQALRTADGRERATILNVLGAIDFRQNEFGDAEPYYRESLKAWTDLGDEEQQAMVLHNLGILLVANGEQAHAMGVLQDAGRRYRDQGSPEKVAMCNLSIGRLLLDLGRYEEAAQRLEESLESISPFDTVRRAIGRSNLAMARLMLGDSRACLVNLDESLRIVEGNSDIGGLASAVAVTVLAMDRMGRSSDARACTSYLLRLRKQYRAPSNHLEERFIRDLDLGVGEDEVGAVTPDQILSYAAFACRTAMADVSLR